MRSNRKHTAVALCATAVLGVSAYGSPRIFMLPTGMSPDCCPAGVPFHVELSPGDELTYDVWVEDVSPTLLKTWQVWMYCSYAGASGEITFVSTVVDDLRCDYVFPIFGVCDPPTVTHLPPTANQGQCPTDVTNLEPRTANVATPNPGPPFNEDFPLVTTARYLSTWTWAVSADAQGLFLLAPKMMDANVGTVLTKLLDPTDELILPLSVDPIEVQVGELPTIEIESSDPPNNAIDARQPSEPDGSNVAGWTSIDIAFTGDASGVTSGDFTVTSDPAGSAPGIADVTVSGNTATVTFDQIIPQLHWTVITFDPSGDSVRIGYLPADVGNDRVSNANDVLTVIDNLNGVIDPLAPYQADVDRSGLNNANDILRTIDLLNGAGDYMVYNGASLPD
ncbi:MAG: hypothetical protein ACE5E6_01725 [Phycisphaerae bacterium]